MSDQPTQPDKFDYLDEEPAGDGLTASYVAPEEPMGVQSFGTTAAEQRLGETFQQRVKHMNPETWARGRTEIDLERRVGRIVQPGDEDVNLADLEASTVAWRSNDVSELTAEEAAMHTTDE